MRQCPNNDGGYDNCKELSDNPNCGYLYDRCVEGAMVNGVCFVTEQVWDCGTLHAIPTLKRGTKTECSGPVRCMGTDCTSPPDEQSTDFGRAAAALQAAQMMATDMQCTPGGSCVVFSGEADACKKAVGGIVNCCTQPEGVSLGNYITLIMSLSKIDSAILSASEGNAIRGAWETLRQPVTSTWSAIQDSFTSVANYAHRQDGGGGHRRGRQGIPGRGQAGSSQTNGDMGWPDLWRRRRQCAVYGRRWTGDDRWGSE